MRYTLLALSLLAASACDLVPPPAPEAPPLPTLRGPGCDARAIANEDLCDGTELALWESGDDPCPEFWEEADVEDGDWRPAGTSWSPDLLGLVPAFPVSGFEWRRAVDGEDGDGVETHETIDSVGTLCEDATNRPACEARVAAVAPGAGLRSECHWECWWTYLVWTAGSEVGVVASRETLSAFLGTIDSTSDAALHLYASTDLTWGDRDIRSGAAREVGGGFELIGFENVSWGFPIRDERVRMSVASDGRFSEVDRAIDEVHCDETIGR